MERDVYRTPDGKTFADLWQEEVAARAAADARTVSGIFDGDDEENEEEEDEEEEDEGRMNTQTTNHLFAWITKTCLADEQSTVANRILSFLRNYPDLVDERSWPEIRILADKHAER